MHAECALIIPPSAFRAGGAFASARYFHLRAVGGGFLGDEDFRLPADDRPESFHHAAGTAEDIMGAKTGVGGIQPGSEPDSARHGVQFRDGEAVFGEHEVGPDHARQVGAELFAARELDQLRRLPPVEIVGDPRRLLAGDAALVEFVAGAVEEIQPVPEFVELLGELRVDQKRLGREQPILVGKKPFRRERRADRVNAVHRRVHESIRGRVVNRRAWFRNRDRYADGRRAEPESR